MQMINELQASSLEHKGCSSSMYIQIVLTLKWWMYALHFYHI